MSGFDGIQNLERVCTLDEGLAIAWLAYEAECQRRGRKPNRQMFAGWAKKVGA